MNTTASRVARRTFHSFAAVAGGGLLLGLLSACQPRPPDRERPPEPQAAQEQVERARHVRADAAEALVGNATAATPG